jgi:DNA primase catalytic subunit
MSKILQEEDIELCRTSKKGFTAKTLFALTRMRKPPKGWKKRAIGTIITDDDWIDAQNGRSRKRADINEEAKQIRKLKSQVNKLNHQLNKALIRISDIESFLDIQPEPDVQN